MSKTEHWLVINYDDTPQLITKKKDYPNSWYWENGIVWCSSQEFPEILYDYGEISSEDDEKYEKIKKHFYKTFRAVKESIPHLSAGWISPSGDFYACNFFEHEGLAKRLSMQTYGKDEGSYLLEKNNWLRVSDDGFVFSKLVDGYDNVTQNQIDTIFDMSVSNNTKLQGLRKYNFVETLKRCLKNILFTKEYIEKRNENI